MAQFGYWLALTYKSIFYILIKDYKDNPFFGCFWNKKIHNNNKNSNLKKTIHIHVSLSHSCI